MRRSRWALLGVLLLLTPLIFAQTPAPHGITLYWTAAPAQPADPNAYASYNVMRAVVTSGTPGTYTQIANVLVTAATVTCPSPLSGSCFTYDDTTGVGGTTYDYEVVTVDAKGYLSTPSPVATATEVANPNPPGAAAATAN